MNLTLTKDSVVLIKGKHTNQWKGRESPEIFPHKYGSLIFHKDTKNVMINYSAFNKWYWSNCISMCMKDCEL